MNLERPWVSWHSSEKHLTPEFLSDCCTRTCTEKTVVRRNWKNLSSVHKCHIIITNILHISTEFSAIQHSILHTIFSGVINFLLQFYCKLQGTCIKVSPSIKRKYLFCEKALNKLSMVSFIGNANFPSSKCWLFEVIYNIWWRVLFLSKARVFA